MGTLGCWRYKNHGMSNKESYMHRLELVEERLYVLEAAELKSRAN